MQETIQVTEFSSTLTKTADAVCSELVTSELEDSRLAKARFRAVRCVKESPRPAPVRMDFSTSARASRDTKGERVIGQDPGDQFRFSRMPTFPPPGLSCDADLTDN